MSQISISHLEKQLNDARLRLARVKVENDGLALEKVMKKPGAAERLEKHRVSLDDASADVSLLESAIEAAYTQNAADFEASKEKERAEHLERAKSLAPEIILKAKQFDRAITDLLSVYEDIVRLEDELSRTVGQAGKRNLLTHPQTRGLPREVFSDVRIFLDGAPFKKIRSAEKLASSAWVFLMDGGQ